MSDPAPSDAGPPDRAQSAGPPEAQPALPPDESGAPLRGIAFILIAMLTFASQDAITKSLAQDLAVAQIVMVRFWMFAVFATLLISRRPGGIPQAARARRPWLQIVRASIFVIEVGLFAWVVGRLPLSTAQAIFAACPLLVTALSPLILGERIGWQRWLAVLAGFLGVIIIIRPDAGLLDPVAILALLGTFLFAVYSLLTRLLAQEDRFETSYGYVAWVGCLLATLVGPFLWQPPTASQVTGLLVLGCTGILGHMLLMKAYELARASVLQPFSYTQLVWGIVIGIFVFGEYPDALMLTGAVIVVAAGIVAMRER